MKIYLIEEYGGSYDDAWQLIKEAYVNKDNAIAAQKKYEEEYNYEREMCLKAEDMYNELMDKYLPDEIDYNGEKYEEAIEKVKNDMGDLYQYCDYILIDDTYVRIVEVELKDGNML